MSHSQDRIDIINSSNLKLAKGNSNTRMDELKESIANALTGGIHYWELRDSFTNSGSMQPEFPARWASDVADEVDKLAELFTSALKAREEEIKQESEQRGVAWSVGVVDDIHGISSMHRDDPIYKGIKNTLRDRYKAVTGIDPAPDYPINVELSQTPQETSK